LECISFHWLFTLIIATLVSALHDLIICHRRKPVYDKQSLLKIFNNEMGFALMAVNIRKYTANSFENETFLSKGIKNACAYLYRISTSIFI